MMVVVAYRSANKTIYSATYHIIWSPKYRRVLGGRVKVRLKEIIAGVVAEAKDEVIEVEVMPDHVHLLVEVPSAAALETRQSLKGRSSRLLRQEFSALRRLPESWASWWFVSTVGGAPPEVDRRYGENQKLAA